jgi:hypothetical protein
MEYILGIAFIAVVAFLLFRKKDGSPTQFEVEIKAVEAKVVEEVKAVEEAVVETVKKTRARVKKAADVDGDGKVTLADAKAAVKKVAAKKTTKSKQV